MKKRMRYGALTLLAGAGLLFVGAAVMTAYAAPPKVKSKNDIVLGLSAPALSEDFWVSMYYGAKEEARKEGVKLITLNAGGYNQIAKQTNQIRDLMERGVNALLIGATNGQGIAPVTKLALSRHIPVVGMSSLPAVKNLTITVGADHFAMGVMQAKAMLKKLHGKGEVAMMNGPAGASWSMARRRGFLSIMRKYPHIKIVANQWTTCSKQKGVNMMQDWVSRYPHLAGVYTACDDMGMAAADVLKSAGRTGKVVVTTSNLDPASEAYIKKGLIYADSAQQIVLQGRLGVKNAINMLLGKPYKKMIKTPPLLITSGNVNTVDLSEVSAPASFNAGG